MSALKNIQSKLENQEQLSPTNQLIQNAIEEWSEENNVLLEFLKISSEKEVFAFRDQVFFSDDISGQLKAKFFAKLCNSYLDEKSRHTWFEGILKSINISDKISFMSALLHSRERLLKEILTDPKQKTYLNKLISYQKNLNKLLSDNIYNEIRQIDFSNKSKLLLTLIYATSADKIIMNSIFEILTERLNDISFDFKEKIEIIQTIADNEDFRVKLEILNTQDKPCPVAYNQLIKFIIENANDILANPISKDKTFKVFFQEIGKIVFTESNFEFVLNIDYDQIISNRGLLRLMGPDLCLPIFNISRHCKNELTANDLSNYNISKISDERLNEMLYFLLVNTYESKSTLFYKLIYTDYIDHKKSLLADVNPSKTSEMEVIYNNEGYLPSINSNLDYTLGSPLKLDDQRKTPIGYNIHLPKGEVKHIIVKIYGGWQAKDLEKSARRPGALHDIDMTLISNKIAVITLNLNDLIDLKVFQGEMPNDVHTKIHECINKFFETIKNEPNILHPKLEKLKNSSIYLEGASFGGRTAIRHAELYPHTFNGYISHDGWIDIKKSIKSARLKKDRIDYATPWLDPALPQHLKNLSDQVLIIQNLDDNNVNAKDAFSFINKAKKLGKINLISLHTENVGNPIPSLEETHNKGHFYPSKGEPGFNTYVNALISFIQGKEGAKIQQTIKKSYKSRKIANKFYIQATPIKRFIAESLLVYMRNKHTPQHINIVENWEKYYQPIADSHFFSENVTTNKNNILKEINRLKTDSLLSDKVIKHVIQKELPTFLKFFEEYYKVSLPQSIDQKMIENKEFIDAVRNTYYSLEHPNANSTFKLLNVLYMTNPDILPDLAAEYSDYKSTLNLYKQKFEKSILEFENLKAKAIDEKMINNLIKGVITASEDTVKLVTGASYETLNPEKSFQKKVLDAIENDNVESLSKIINSDYNLNFTIDEENQKTPLMLAIEKGGRQVIDVMLKKIKESDSLNARDNSGKTALMIAVEYDDLDTIKSLINKKADFSIKSLEGLTAFNYALAYGAKDEILNLLKTSDDQKISRKLRY